MIKPLKTFAAAITDTRVYARLIQSSFKTALTYFLFWHTVLGCILGIILAFQLPPILEKINQELEYISGHYPPNLLITIKDGRLSTNHPQPIVIPSASSGQNLVTIDAGKIAEDITSLESYILLTSEAAAILLDPGDPPLIQITRYADVTPDIVITRSELTTYFDLIIRLINALERHRFVIAVGAAVIGLSIARLVSLLINSLFFWLGARLAGWPFTYRQTLTLSLYTGVVAETVFRLAQIVYSQVPGFLLSMAYFGTTVIALISVSRSNPQKKL